MRVIVAKSAGFCFGVQRAVSICERAVEEYDNCITLGPIIHNEHVVRYFENKGLKTIQDISEVSPQSTVIVRSHGAVKEEYEILEGLDVNVIDATCPDVQRIHNIVRDESSNGRLLVIVGDRLHPEVRAIASWCSNYNVFETVEEFLEWLSFDDNAQKPVSFVFQTTNKKSIYYSFVEIIKKECTNYNIFDTICKATRKRQQEAEELSTIADVMVVVGDMNSANSLRLAEICTENCKRVYLIENAKGLDIADIRLTDTVGVTAGASTPAWIIKEVTQKMSEEVRLGEDSLDQELKDAPIEYDSQLTINNEQLSTDAEAHPIIAEVSEVAAEETASMNDEEPDVSVVDSESVSAESTENEVTLSDPGEMLSETVHQDPESSEHVSFEDEGEETSSEDASVSHETFEEMLEKSIKTLHTGQKVSGVVTSITSTEVSVDLGAKQSGYIPVSEFADDQNTSIDDIVKIGDTIESFVMRVNDVEGMVMLSKKRLDAIKNWDEIEMSKENRSIVEGVVTEENKGGVVVNVKGVRVFVPASQTGLPKSAPMSEIVRKTVKLRITEVNQSRRRVVGSIRAVQADERRERSERLWDEIETGKQYDGVVKSMTSYGVFVDIGGVDGMIHISELSWTRIKQPSEVMSVGDEVSVYVLSFDKDNKKISLGYKKNEDNPWTKFTKQYAVGNVISVKIVKMMPFGAFAEICPGVDGLIHISQITDHRIGLPSEVLTDGQVVDVKITEIDFDRKKVSLSIRALIDPSSQPLSEKESAEAVVADNTPVIVYDTDSPPVSDDEQKANESEEPEVAVDVAEEYEKSTVGADEAL